MVILGFMSRGQPVIGCLICLVPAHSVHYKQHLLLFAEILVTLDRFDINIKVLFRFS